MPAGLLGRVSSAQTLITWGVQPVGALLRGLVSLKPLCAHFLAAALKSHLATSPEHEAAVTLPEESR